MTLREVDLKKWVALDDFCCPAKGCQSRKPSTWVCAKDGGTAYMNAEGKIKCESGTHIDDICKWGWKCGSSIHKGEYIRADYEGFTFAMSQALQLASKTSVEWITTLLRNLDKQFNTENERLSIR